MVELAVETGASSITAVEWLFLLSGGLTVAYLTKIYVAVFWQKARQMPTPPPALGNAPPPWRWMLADTVRDAGSAAPWAVGEARRRYPLLHRRS
ncbi:MAG: hypothetical protein ACLUIX_09805 [Oscillospiraceae bacterium]